MRSHLPPEPLPAGVEVAVVLMQGSPQPVRYCSLDGVLPQDVGKPPAIARGPLPPFHGFVIRLIDSGGEPDFRETKGIHHVLK